MVKRENGDWVARYTAGIHPGTDKAIRKSIYGKTQEEVTMKLRKTLQGCAKEEKKNGKA